LILIEEKVLIACVIFVYETDMHRRNFLRLSATTAAAILYNRLTYAGSTGSALINPPDEAWAKFNDHWVKLTGSGSNVFSYQDIHLELETNGNGKAAYIQSPSVSLQGIRLQWKYNPSSYSKVLGDHWERSYGDLSWKVPQTSIKLPWYILLHDTRHTACFGVKTGANSICYWTVTGNAVELTMDTTSGGVGVMLGQRKLHAADIVVSGSKTGEKPFATATRFCRVMCPHPRLPKQPVYGINDWYAVYGNNSSSSIKSQTAFMAELITNVVNRPFSLIDDGWQVRDDFSKANDKFKDMRAMAEEIKRLGMRPGLWTRPLIARDNDKPSLLAPTIKGRNEGTKNLILDPTVPETIERIQNNLHMYRLWGYEMVKHDFTSYDIFGRWGSQMTEEFTVPGWKFNDQSKTNAEIINHLYRSIREAAGEMYIIGCNTMSHLSAGIFELNRTGDDTSGKEWARTRKMGVNTLGFRLPQHNTFYAADGDCVGLTKDVPWGKNKQWLQLLSESGAPLFISAELDAIKTEQKAAVKEAFAKAAKVQPTGEPLDWMTSSYPSKWKLNGRIVEFDWE
jgi:alpha-galactosidase